MPKPYKPKTRPFPHQAKATIRLLRRKNHALFMEPRTGKTKSALDAIAMLALRPTHPIQKVLVLCPLIALDVWTEQIKQHFPLVAHCEDAREVWTVNSKKHGPPTVYFYFLNYEKAASRKRTRRGWTYPYLEEIEKWFIPDVIVCDESHKLKRAGGVTAQAVWRLVRRMRTKREDGTPYVWLLTGTPAPRGWLDLFAQFRVMDEDVFGTSKAEFIDRFVVFGYGPMRYTVVKYRNETGILDKVNENAFTCTAEEAGLAGEQFWQRLWVDLPPKVWRQYRQMAKEFITELDTGEVIDAANPAVKRMRLLQITGGFTTAGNEVHGEKVAKLRAYATDLYEQGESVVVYARHLPEVDACQQALLEVGYPSTAITGAVPRHDRTRAVADFQRSDEPMALVFQVQTGALAIELSRAAEVIFYSVPDGWEAYWQCLNRVMGPNQKRPVRYTHILARNTLDLAVMEGLVRKEDWHRVLMKDPKRYLLGMIATEH